MCRELMVLVGNRVTRSVATAVAQTRGEVAWTRWWEWRWVVGRVRMCFGGKADRTYWQSGYRG